MSWCVWGCFFKCVPVQSDRGRLHFPGISFELVPSEGAGLELQPPGSVGRAASVCSGGRPTMQPAEAQVAAAQINRYRQMTIKYTVSMIVRPSELHCRLYVDCLMLNLGNSKSQITFNL